MRINLTRAAMLAAAISLAFGDIGVAKGELRAGAASVDVTPIQLPVLVNGGMLSRSVSEVKTRLSARALVLDDGQTRIGIVVVDSCMMPRPLLDEIKQQAAVTTKLQPDRILISATHTHSAPASMSCLGTNADPTYIPLLKERVVQALQKAEANLAPAQVGWGSANAAEFTALRRWVRRPDRIANDPFGNPTVRANMHSASSWDNVTGESGPEDPELSMLSVQSSDGEPVALLANFSMHYFSGERGLSADYFGLFCEGLESELGGKKDRKASFVGIMSHGCSGDIWRRDYRIPPDKRSDPTIESYAEGLLKITLETYKDIEHRKRVELAMAETRLQLNYRVPDEQRLEWAREVVAAMGDRAPKTQSEVYAVEQIILHERQSTDVVVQALRIGDFAIATTPNETYALTGLKIKLQSPLEKTMVIELANGGDGYIPPPEQHFLGGYNTWAARSAGLEVLAEPKIAEAAIGLLERVAERPRREFRQSFGPRSAALKKAKPVAYWRLDEFAGPVADDSAGNRAGFYEPGVVFFLEGPDRVCRAGEINRAAHFAGGRLRTRLADLGDRYSVALWFWNGMPSAARDVAGWIFSRGFDHGAASAGEHLGLGGKKNATALMFQHGTQLVAGRTAIERWTWNHLVLVREHQRLRVYLNGNSEPEIDADLEPLALRASDCFFGGRNDNQSNWEGRLDEIAVFDRALSSEEVAELYGKP